MLGKERQIEKIARKYSKATDFLYLGRGINYPVALEGALKLKEISYIHAEGYSAGEMKHGPIALIDENMPVVVLIPNDNVFEKTLSNLKEVESRNGTDYRGDRPRKLRAAKRSRWEIIVVPANPSSAVAGADDSATAVARVSYRGVPRHRRRPAAQSGQVSHRRVGQQCGKGPGGSPAGESRNTRRDGGRRAPKRTRRIRRYAPYPPRCFRA